MFVSSLLPNIRRTKNFFVKKQIFMLHFEKQKNIDNIIKQKYNSINIHVLFRGKIWRTKICTRTTVNESV